MSKNKGLRRCVGCNQMKDKSCLIRVVRSPEGDISIDKTGKKNGRGTYICLSAECLEKSEKAHRLEKSFKCSVSPEIYASLKLQLEKLGVKELTEACDE